MIFIKERKKKVQVGPLYLNSPLPVHRRCPRCCTTTPVTTASVTVASSCCRTPACCWASASCCWSLSLSTTSIWTWTIDPDQPQHHCQGPLSHTIFRFFCAYDLNFRCDESVFCCRSPSPSSLAQLPDILSWFRDRPVALQQKTRLIFLTLTWRQVDSTFCVWSSLACESPNTFLCLVLFISQLLMWFVFVLCLWWWNDAGSTKMEGKPPAPQLNSVFFSLQNPSSTSSADQL